jgi:hypothetical protein
MRLLVFVWWLLDLNILLRRQFLMRRWRMRRRFLTRNRTARPIAPTVLPEQTRFMLDLTYARDGRPIGVAEWGRLSSQDDYRVVAQEQIGPYFVSTVWLGLDHGLGRTERPILFETMVFVPEHANDFSLATDTHRYCTESEAIAGHADVVATIRATSTFEAESLLETHVD